MATKPKKAVAKTAAAKAPAKAPAKAKAKAAVKKPAAAKVLTTLTQAQLNGLVAEGHDMPKAEAKRFVDGVMEIIARHVLKGVKVKIGTLGTLSLQSRKARMGRNPRTGEAVKIKASRKLRFRQSTTIRDLLAPKK